MDVNKKELVDRWVERTGEKKNKATANLEALMEVITDALADGETIKLTGFCSLGTKEVAARNGVNPQTGEPVKIPAKVKIWFKPGKILKGSV